ncbi:MAG: hypothetical protein ACOYL8_01805 [Patescibacteria group bacterium]
MKIINKKPFIFGLGAIFCLSFLFIYSLPARALDTKIRQVRTSDNPAVYFLYHGGHRKKAYLNADIYLDYGNKWPDVKIISSLELNSWPDVKLVKKADSSAVYFIRGNKKAVIKRWEDLENFNLASEPILNVSQKELNYYDTLSYEGIGLITSTPSAPTLTTPIATTTKPVASSTTPIATTTKPVVATTTTPVATSTPVTQSGTLLVYNDLVKGSNSNTILTGSNNNLVGIFRFRSPEQVATITVVTFDFTGLYNEGLLRSAKVYDENNIEYQASLNLSQSRRQLTVNLRNPITLNPGSEKTMKVYLDLATGTYVNNTIRVEIKAATNISSNRVPTASFPLRGTEFKTFDGGTILAKLSSQEEKVALNQGISIGNRLIAKYTLNEESGNEEVLVNKLIFHNTGSAGKNDWEDFRLFNNGQIISRASALDTNRDIVFNVNYLRIKKGAPAVLSIFAALKTDRSKTATVNLQLDEIFSTGKTYNTSLSPTIINIDENFNLN